MVVGLKTWKAPRRAQTIPSPLLQLTGVRKTTRAVAISTGRFMLLTTLCVTGRARLRIIMETS